MTTTLRQRNNHNNNTTPKKQPLAPSSSCIKTTMTACSRLYLRTTVAMRVPSLVLLTLSLTALYSSIHTVIEASFSKLEARHQVIHQSKPYYRRWDPVTHSISVPFIDRHDVEKPTSLEILQDILQDTENQLLSSYSSSSSSSPFSSCYAPNIKQTRDLADRIQSSTASLGLPLLNVGFPKSGSSTLRTFLREKLGWNASHYSLQFDKDGDDTGDADDNDDENRSNSQNRSLTVGEQMIKAVNEKLSPFALLSNSANKYKIFQAHTQLDYTSSDQIFFPQIQLLDEIHMAEPNSTFVLLFRPVNDWIKSTQSWHNYPIRLANSHEDLPDLGSLLTNQQRIARNQRGEKIILTEQQLERWWCIHVHHVRNFVAMYPSHNLIELDLYDTDGSTTELLRKLFGSAVLTNNNNKHSHDQHQQSVPDKNDDEHSKLWSAANRNPIVKEKRPGPTSMNVHYFRLWNHSSNTLNYLNVTSKDRYFDIDLPTSLEILEDVMKRRQTKKNPRESEGDCFYPRQRSKKRLATNATYPVLHVGLPLVGNEFLKTFFRSCMGLQATSKKVTGGGLVGKKMMEAVHAGVPPISGYFGHGRSAFLQLDYTQVLPNTASSKFEQIVADDNAEEGRALPLSAFPQIQLLDEIHEDVPHSTFILPFRSTVKTRTNSSAAAPIQGWIDLAQKFHNFTERWASMEDIPGLILTEDQKHARQNKKNRRPDEPMLPLNDDQLSDWWCVHVQHIREFVETYPSHTLLEINLLDHDETTSTLLSAFPQADGTCLSKLLCETNLL